MKLELSIETSSRSASVAARLGERVARSELASTRAHASDLLPALDQLVRELGAQPREAAAVYVGTGPGSYTGLRVGIATALGIARSTGAALVGVCSFEVLLWERLAPGESGGVLLDGRSGGYYHARYRREAGELVELLAPAILPEAQARERAAQDGRTLGVEDVPTALALLELGAARLARSGPMQPAEVQPLYLRPFRATERTR
ncbi:MAG: tRNA (adenosine(37)-N6)-threonylcarbamoyltransferase complex dimerization subunit type 1 TsaB [Planctomycetes bacterium]|nr:tRNA (adenosine(37)-N6)-threonylcarbamoyltransferase complex dimerization subunit type 1 TsaB [Planctomycetota bacterium]